MYANASKNTPSYTHVSSYMVGYMVWRVHPQGSYMLWMKMTFLEESDSGFPM